MKKFIIMDYNTMSNSELQAEQERLTNEYNEAKDIIAKTYAKMCELSNEYEQVKAIINKREGKA